MARRRHRPSFWLFLVVATAFLSLEPALFLVILALALSAVTLGSLVMLARALITDAFAGHTRRGPVPEPANEGDSGAS